MYNRVWIAGHRGLVGAATKSYLLNKGYEVLTAEKSDLDLRDSLKVLKYLRSEKPDAIIVAAAKVGGILANDIYAADFISDNLIIQNNVINGAHVADINRLVFLGSSCVYPKLAPQPLKEEYLLTSSLETTNQWYAIAKIAGIKLCEAYKKQYNREYISLMPCNLYGENDNFDPLTSHVIPGLIAKIFSAQQSKNKHITIWGSGTALREFLYVDDIASAIELCLNDYRSLEPINCGSGKETSIKDLVELLVDIIGYSGEILFDKSKPDGVYRKVLDSSKLRCLGWRPKIELRPGLMRVCDFYRRKNRI